MQVFPKRVVVLRKAQIHYVVREFVDGHVVLREVMVKVLKQALLYGRRYRVASHPSESPQR